MHEMNEDIRSIACGEVAKAKVSSLFGRSGKNGTQKDRKTLNPLPKGVSISISIAMSVSENGTKLTNSKTAEI
jgi:hypothetical protein